MSTFHTGLTGDLSLSQLGKPNGFASLNNEGKLVETQVPTSLKADVSFLIGQIFYSTSNESQDGPSNVILTPGGLYEAVFGTTKWMVI